MKATSPGFCALYSETEKQLRSTIAAAGGALKHCVRSFHGQPGALSWLAKTDVSMSTLPSIRCTPAFQRRHHIANILPFKRRIAAEARNQVAFQHAAVKGTFGFQRGGKAKIGPQLQQRRQRGDDLCVLAGSAICWL